ncbi:MAG: TIM barrel protein [Bacteroides sp.]|nr:TIM barrel protein [Bacteroides sp.]
MIKPGLTSVTFRDKSPGELVRLALKAGLRGIEWGGDIHVPAGEPELAEEAYRLTMEAGLEVSAYGSYYVVGRSRDEGLRFEDVLQTADLLHAPVLRLWAGEVGSRESDSGYRRKVVDETRELADMAGKMGIRLAFEFHDNTLNDSYEACDSLFHELDHPEISTYWQPVHGAGPLINRAGIDCILPWICGFHIFHWWPDAEVRLPLRDGAGDWKQYLHILSRIPGSLFGSLEFVKDDSDEQFFEDAKTLVELAQGC